MVYVNHDISMCWTANNVSDWSFWLQQIPQFVLEFLHLLNLIWIINKITQVMTSWDRVKKNVAWHFKTMIKWCRKNKLLTHTKQYSIHTLCRVYPSFKHTITGPLSLFPGCSVFPQVLYEVWQQRVRKPHLISCLDPVGFTETHF